MRRAAGQSEQGAVGHAAGILARRQGGGAGGEGRGLRRVGGEARLVLLGLQPQRRDRRGHARVGRVLIHCRVVGGRRVGRRRRGCRRRRVGRTGR